MKPSIYLIVFVLPFGLVCDADARQTDSQHSVSRRISGSNEHDLDPSIRRESQISHRQTETRDIEITLCANNGRVSWAAIADSVAKQIGVAIPVLKRLPQTGTLDLNARTTRWILVGINLALQPTIRISVDRRTQLVTVTIDHSEIEHARKKWGARLRQKLDDTEIENGERFGLTAYGENSDLFNAKRIAILVHGFNSHPNKLTPLAKKIESLIESESFTVASFHYATRNGIEGAANEFKASLRDLIQKNPACEIALITHSMGGLISRCAIEDESFQCKQIKQLIMVAPPNRGSNLALLPVGTDQIDLSLATIDRTKIRSVIRNFVGEANTSVEDLRPESALIKKLNSRDRNPNVKYSIILGCRALLTHSQGELLKIMSHRMKSASAKPVSRTGAELSTILRQLSGELVSPSGDGVVNVDHGVLKGVDDVVILEFRHNDLLSNDSQVHEKIVREIIARIQSNPQMPN